MSLLSLKMNVFLIFVSSQQEVIAKKTAKSLKNVRVLTQKNGIVLPHKRGRICHILSAFCICFQGFVFLRKTESAKTTDLV